ncbi:MAG: PEP-CTERM sorting domain-containing protein [Gammaproteobacteria bacterium]
MSKTACLALVAAVATLAFAPSAQATPVNYDFTVNVTSGPLSGAAEHGSFAYDSSSITPSSRNNAAGLLTMLDFTFNGITYTAATANTGWLEFNAGSDLISFAFGTDCASGNCVVNQSTDEWWAVPGHFSYSTSTFDGFGSGNVTFALAPVGVPEPGTLGLFGFGSLALGVAGWRRRRLV